MYRFLLRPRWLLSHLFVAAVLVAFVSAGLWQLRRLDERRATNVLVEERFSGEPTDVADVVTVDADEATVEAAEYRRIEATGAYAPVDQVLIANRTQDGAPGYWVVTPLVLADGSAVAVNRGWVPFGDTDLDGAGREYPPPEGEVTVTGIAHLSQERQGIGVADAAEGRLTTLNRVDVGRIDAQSDLDLLPLYIDLVTAVPEPVDPPRPLPPPELSEGPHQGYAVQWFLFATVVVVGYPLALRRIAHQRLGGGDAGADIAVDGHGAPAGRAADDTLETSSP